MDLKSITTASLLERTKTVAKEEKEALNSLLHHIAEVYLRKAFLDAGCGSLHQYVRRELKYGDSAASSRITAMFALLDVPEAEEMVKDGSLSLSHLREAGSLFNREDLPRETKAQIVKEIANKTTREAKKILASHSSDETRYAEKIKVRKNTVRLEFDITHECDDKVQKLKGLLAHRNPSMSMAEFFEELCDIAIKKLDPAQKPRRKQPARGVHGGNDRYVPAAAEAQVWKEANSVCSSCGDNFLLQVDHVMPVGFGGRTEPANLRLLCRNCNIIHATNTFGADHMRQFFQ